ncbi:gliding motility-associated ABC transporter permease subunit GldF [Gramella sp. GC03-9]|uniref:Gliding motility-associated ABC transporter permease subunit GldF n=1 Tax=Christiangramia oceanisediminis TaxID=2920386 RepID=A0A9X2RC58_9FLAO|nr:gliding motility-associated ABC transporter permease subunit GldF [Gramella oceanisediminis]MCP9200785.1 gliding motility-associated ABC transporter permease subunit GldF [Gramella oceanisediminis]
MFAILNKEIQSFFSSLTGYLVIGLFLLISGLFLFVFSGGYNILDSGFADLKPFFSLAPWIFLFLIPAISMRSFSEEKRMGTMEILLTKPIRIWQLILGKYLGILLLIGLAILPSLLYIYTISELGRPEGNFDAGATLGSYLGLLFLGGCYAAIGVFASSLSSNQIVAFLLGVFLCFVCYFGFEGISQTGIFGNSTYIVESFGINFHYQSISRGVIDSRDLIYFLSVILLFLKLTEIRLSATKSSRS